MFNDIKKAITFSFDDGVIQDIKIIEILNKYNMKATFNLNSGRFGQSFPFVWNGVNVERKIVLPNMVRNSYLGHEVAVHTVNHVKLKSISDDEIVREITEDINNLEKLVGYQVRGMAYPCNEVDDRVLKVIKERTQIKYARTTVATHTLELQTELFRFNPSCWVFDEDVYNLADELISCDDDTPKLLYIWGHCYEFDYNPDNYKKFEEFCKYVSFRKNIAYLTNIQAFKMFGQI